MASKPLGVEVHDRNLKPPLPDPDDVTEEDQRLALLAAEPDLRLEDWSALVGAPRRHFEVGRGLSNQLAGSRANLLC